MAPSPEESRACGRLDEATLNEDGQKIVKEILGNLPALRANVVIEELSVIDWNFPPKRDEDVELILGMNGEPVIKFLVPRTADVLNLGPVQEGA